MKEKALMLPLGQTVSNFPIRVAVLRVRRCESIVQTSLEALYFVRVVGQVVARAVRPASVSQAYLEGFCGRVTIRTA